MSNVSSTFSGLKGIKDRLLFVLLGIFIYRLGAHIPVPSLDPVKISAMLFKQHNNIFGLFNLFSGGAFMRLSVFALGIMPYISASIIIQLFTSISTFLEQLKNEGEVGKRKINQITRYTALVLSIIQAIGMSKFLSDSNVAYFSGFGFYVTTVVSLVTGTMFLVWLGEQITEKGLGNGISLIIFSGIVAGLPGAFQRTIEQLRLGQIHFLTVLLILVLLIAVFYFIVFVERAQRKIPVHYAHKNISKGYMMPSNTTHLPLKINMAGVIPPIFAYSIILFPITVAQFFANYPGFTWLSSISLALSQGQPLHLLIFVFSILFFSFFFTALIFNPKETAENLKKSGAFIPGIRPGQFTAKYIDEVMTRLTLIGALYVTAVCLVPELLSVYLHIPINFGGTSLLIIVVVTIDFIGQIQSYLMSNQYQSIMKKVKQKINR